MQNFTVRFDEMLDSIGITAYKLSKEIGTSEAVISSIRSGKTKPSFDFLSKLLSKYEAINTNYLITGQGELSLKPASTRPASGDFGSKKNENDPLPGSETEGKLSPTVSPTVSPTLKNKGKTDSYSGSSLNEMNANYGAKTPAIITLNEHGIDNIIYVPVKAQAGYLVGYADQEYIESLPSFRMPGLNNGTYRMFETEGISMQPTLTNNDRVIGQWVDNMENIRENRVHVVVSTRGVLIKRVLNRIKERGLIYLKSDTISHRHDYPMIELDASEVKEIWYVRMKVSSDLSEPSEIYNRVADLEIKQTEIMKVLRASNLIS